MKEGNKPLEAAEEKEGVSTTPLVVRSTLRPSPQTGVAGLSRLAALCDLRQPRFYSYEMFMPTRRRVHVKENTWAEPATQVWPQNLFLCKYLEMRAERDGLHAFQDKKVLEVGAGRGPR